MPVSRPTHISQLHCAGNERAGKCRAESMTKMDRQTDRRRERRIRPEAHERTSAGGLADDLEVRRLHAAFELHVMHFAIARDIARAHGGDIRLEDSPLGGLRAIVEIPV